MEKKIQIKEELLHQQLELLAERSANEANVEQLLELTLVMVKVYKALSNNQMIQVTPLINGVEI